MELLVFLHDAGALASNHVNVHSCTQMAGSELVHSSLIAEHNDGLYILVPCIISHILDDNGPKLDPSGTMTQVGFRRVQES